MQRGSNVLDHATLMGDVTVGAGAVLGTYTLAPWGRTFPPRSVSTGVQAGRESESEREREKERRRERFRATFA